MLLDLDAKAIVQLQRSAYPVFQLDGTAMRSLLRLLKPSLFEHISAVIALYRPGPMGMNSHINYAQRKNGLQQAIDFPSGSSWICFSDQTPHAAMGGQYMLEQTFLLPVTGMKYPEQSPLKILESLMHKSLI